MNRSKIYQAMVIISLIAFVYHMAYTQYLVQGTHRHVITHLGFGLIIAFLTGLHESKTKIGNIVYAGLLFLSAGASFYIWYHYEALLSRVWSPTTADLIVGVILLIACYVACIRYFGTIVPLIAAIFVIYPFFGHYLPEPFYSISYPLTRTINNLTTSLGGGIFEIPLGVSARVLFLVVVLGFLLNGLGATKFFLIIARRYQHRLKSGPGLLAVISSAGVGSVVGSGEANVAITGSFTIPTMLKAGYKPELAAGIEATASIGGQILPPIMGCIAFVMVGYTGIPYVEVLRMALIPAIIYFFFVGMHIHLTAMQQDYTVPDKIERTPEEDKAEIKELLQSLVQFAVPFFVLIYLIAAGNSVTYAIFWAIAGIFVVSFMMKDKRPSFDTIVSSLVEGAQNGAAIAAMCAVVGLIITSLNMSGMGVKLTAGIESWTGGNLLLGLLIIVTISIVMGLTGIATASYVLVAIFAVPALLRMGLEFQVAHFFALYPTTFTFITPPVALSVLVASRIAGSNYFKSCIEAIKIATSGFLLPFLFVYAPVLLWRPPNSATEAVLDIIACLTCLLAIQIGNVGYFFTKIKFLARLVYYLAGILLFVFVLTKNDLFLGAGLITLIILLVFCYVKKKREAELNNQTAKVI